MTELRTLSDFLRRSGDVLEDLDDGDVVLRRRDGEDVVLTTVPRDRAVRDASRLVAEVLVEALEDPPLRAHLGEAAGRSVPWLDLIDPPDRAASLLRIARALMTWEELGTAEPLERALEAARRRARRGGTELSGWARPVALPHDLESSADKATGIVELPLHIRWSGPARRYDLDDPDDLRRVYEQVLREGTEDDVRRFVDLGRLLEVWDELVLPRHVRRAWAERLDAL